MIGATINAYGRTGPLDMLPSQRVIILNSTDAMEFGIVKSINQMLNKAEENKKEESKPTATNRHHMICPIDRKGSRGCRYHTLVESSG